jgi:hypothetical protein
LNVPPRLSLGANENVCVKKEIASFSQKMTRRKKMTVNHDEAEPLNHGIENNIA